MDEEQLLKATKTGFIFAMLVSRAMGERFNDKEALQAYLQEVAEGATTLDESPLDAIRSMEVALNITLTDDLRAGFMELFRRENRRDKAELHRQMASIVLQLFANEA